MLFPNKFYIHTANTSVLGKLNIAMVQISNDSDFIQLMFPSMHNEFYLFTSVDKLDVSILVGMRRCGLTCVCETGCCGIMVDLNRFINYFYSYPMMISRLGLSSGKFKSGFGFYIRELFFKWIKSTSYFRYILHGCEDESLTYFSKLKDEKEIIFYGKPIYNSKTFLISKDCDEKNLSAFAKMINFKYNGLLTIESFLEYKFVPQHLGIFDNSTYDDVKSVICHPDFGMNYVLCEHGSVNVIRSPVISDNRFCFYFFNDILIDCKPTVIQHGFINDIFVFRSGEEFTGFVDFDVVYKNKFITLLSLTKITTTTYSSEFSTKAVAQRCLINYGDMYDVAKQYQAEDEVNIAIFVTDAYNSRRWCTGSKPVSNVIGTMACLDYANFINYEVSYRHKVHTYKDGDYEDILMSNIDMYSLGYNYISIPTFECLLFPQKYIPDGARYDPNDVRRFMIGIYTDKDTNCNVQNSWTSSTFDLKAVSLYKRRRSRMQDDAIYKERFSFLLSCVKPEKEIYFKTKTMWSLAYYFKRGENVVNIPEKEEISKDRIKFLDISGHFINYIHKTKYLITDMKGHFNMILRNDSGSQKIWSYFGIDVSQLASSSKFVNPESRTPLSDDDELWHSYPEYESAFRYAAIELKSMSGLKIDKLYSTYMDDLKQRMIGSDSTLLTDNRLSLVKVHDYSAYREVIEEVLAENLMS